MANYTLTLADLEKAVTHALGGAPDANLDVDGVINDALSHLCQMRQWHWRQKALALDSVNAQSYVALPADFGEILTVKKYGDTQNSVKPTTIDSIVQMRQTGATISDTWYALSYLAQASLTTEPTPILELFPTPTATTTLGTYLVGVYLRQVPKLAGSTSFPDIPSGLHPILRTLCRAFAVSDEEQQRGADWAKFEDMIQSYLVADGRMTGYQGRARGGLAPPRPASLAQNTRQIGGP